MKRNIKIFIVAVLCLTMFIGCTPKQPADTATSKDSGYQDGKDVDLIQLAPVKAGETIATMTTSMGVIKFKFFPDKAPKAVENFVTHAKKGYYNGLKFHRVMEDFMLQSGDPEGTGRGGKSIWNSPFNDEFSSQLFNFRGSLSMANSGENTNGSQFFIVQKTTVDQSTLDQLTGAGYPKNAVAKYKELGGTPWLDNKHTVFGFVIEGMDIVDKIANCEKDPEILDGSGTPYVPKPEIKIIKLEITTAK